jgi:uncharacterized protein HemX
MKRYDQKGSHLVAALLLVVVIGVIALAGYKVWQMQSNNTSPTSNTTASSATVPATIQSKADLTQASHVLDQASTQLNSSLDDSTMNADINSML